MIHWKLRKCLKLDDTTQWFKQKPESVRENDVHKNLSDVEVQTDHLSQAKRPDLEGKKKKKKNQLSSLFCRFSGP